MLDRDPVKIPTIQGKINFKKQNGMVYVRYLAERRYDADNKSNTPNWVNIGRQIEAMPTLMYPNDNYAKYFGREGGEPEEEMTMSERWFARDNGTYGMYYPFFIALYNEFKQHVRKCPKEMINAYKAECINRLLRPLREMMKNEKYGELLGFVETGNAAGDAAIEQGTTGAGTAGMDYGDVMFLLTQYKSALIKYRRYQM